MIQNNNNETSKNYNRSKHNRRWGNPPRRDGNNQGQNNPRDIHTINKNDSGNQKELHNRENIDTLRTYGQNHRKHPYRNKKSFNDKRTSLYPIESEERKAIREQREKMKKANVDFSDLTRPKKINYNPTCIICHKTIEDSNMAIAHSNSAEAVHFDCVVNQLTQTEKLSENESIVYTGNGNFSVVSYTGANHKPKNLTIVRKISYEEYVKDKASEWRKALMIIPTYIINVEENTVKLKERLLREETSNEKTNNN